MSRGHGPAAGAAAEPIDRQALVTRHNPVVRSVDPAATLTVGNGGFAFGCDVTGFQVTFAALHQAEGVPAETLARWCWVTDPNPQGFTLADASRDYTGADGRTLSYPTRSGTPAGDWLRRTRGCTRSGSSRSNGTSRTARRSCRPISRNRSRRSICGRGS